MGIDLILHFSGAVGAAQILQYVDLCFHKNHFLLTYEQLFICYFYFIICDPACQGGTFEKLS